MVWVRREREGRRCQGHDRLFAEWVRWTCGAQLGCCTWRKGDHKGLARKGGGAETACGVSEEFALKGVEGAW